MHATLSMQHCTIFCLASDRMPCAMIWCSAHMHTLMLWRTLQSCMQGRQAHMHAPTERPLTAQPFGFCGHCKKFDEPMHASLMHTLMPQQRDARRRTRGANRLHLLLARMRCSLHTHSKKLEPMRSSAAHTCMHTLMLQRRGTHACCMQKSWSPFTHLSQSRKQPASFCSHVSSTAHAHACTHTHGPPETEMACDCSHAAHNLICADRLQS